MTLFLAATGMTTLAVAGTAPILPLLQAHFSYVGNAALLSRATITIGCIGIVVGAPLTAFAAARLGRKPLLVGSALVFTIAGCCGFVVDNLYVIVASRFLVGATSALVTTLTATIVAESYDEAGRNRWMGIMVGVGTLFAMALLPLAGVLGDMDWRECFLLHLIGAPVVILAWLGYQSPNTIRTAARTNAGGRASIRLDLIALGLCAGIAINAQSVYAPFKLYAMGVRSAALIGVSLMPLTLFAAFTSPFYGKLRTRASAALAKDVPYPHQNATFWRPFSFSSCRASSGVATSSDNASIMPRIRRTCAALVSASLPGPSHSESSSPTRTLLPIAAEMVASGI
jgi:MFS family permease